jgi:hypothetical protein
LTSHKNTGRYQSRLLRVKSNAHFSLTRKHFSSITGSDPCNENGSPSS